MLSSQGIAGAPDALIAAAHETCDARGLPRIGIGITPPYTVATIKIRDELSGQGLSQQQMEQFTHDAFTGYCP